MAILVMVHFALRQGVHGPDTTSTGRRHMARFAAEGVQMLAKAEPASKAHHKAHNGGVSNEGDNKVNQGVHGAEGGVSIETQGFSSRLGAKWPPRTRFTTGPKHKGGRKKQPKRLSEGALTLLFWRPASSPAQAGGGAAASARSSLSWTGQGRQGRGGGFFFFASAQAVKHHRK